MSHKFGTEITNEDIVETLSFFDSWEDRYKYIIDLGKELPTIDETLKTDEHIVRGCQSQVWLVADTSAEKLTFQVDSDAHIVKGLLAVVLAAFNGKTPKAILDFQVDDYFGQLDLVRHLSPTRGNGLKAMVKKIKDIATDVA
jgi:cysteine desulfuration protein SufE